MSRQEQASGGIGVAGLLGVLFVTLKLLEITVVATWSWWWVTLPFWIGPAVFLVVFLGLLIVWAVAALIALLMDK